MSAKSHSINTVKKKMAELQEKVTAASLELEAKQSEVNDLDAKKNDEVQSLKAQIDRHNKESQEITLSTNRQIDESTQLKEDVEATKKVN